MIKKLTNKKIVLISATVMIVVLTLGFTLALWSRNFTQTGTNTITSDCFNIEYSESEATSLINSYPQTDEDGLKNVSYDVTIENTCNTVTNYSVVLNELSSNTLAESRVKVAINDSYKMLNTYESATPSADVDNASSARLLTLGVLGPQQERTISIKSWMDEDTTELEGENKTFGYKITIEATAGTNKLLAAEVLKTPITKTAIDYSVLPESGLYAANDNDGESYFFRGNIDNNYVDLGLTYPSNIGMYWVGYHGSKLSSYDTYAWAANYCTYSYTTYGYESTEECMADIQDHSVHAGDKMLFRIVRINGDGTIRLISDVHVGRSAFNNYSDETYDKKYVGYTYDNSKICTASSPCNGTEGTSSTIKSYLESWYTSNIASTSLNNKIATTTYCNDTSYTGGQSYNYASYTRVSVGNPSLECPDTTLTYGGIYKLKVGLANADEMRMAGIGWWATSGSNARFSNYLYTLVEFWTISPQIKYDTYSYSIGCWNSISGGIPKGSLGVRPIINLVSDAKVASGNGTESSPYVIDMN